MEEEKKQRQPHCLVLFFPTQGHINPMLQFSKRLKQKGVRVTLVTTHFACKTLLSKESTSMALESISDGFDEAGLAAAESYKIYLDSFWQAGPRTLAQLIEKLIGNGNPVD